MTLIALPTDNADAAAHQRWPLHHRIARATGLTGQSGLRTFDGGHQIGRPSRTAVSLTFQRQAAFHNSQGRFPIFHGVNDEREYPAKVRVRLPFQPLNSLQKNRPHGVKP